MNKYFLIKKTLDNTFTIINGPDYLPQTFGPTSGFNNLETNAPELLPDLSWQENSDLGFWLAVFDDKPICNIDQKITENYVINSNTKTCRVSYTVESISPSESDIRIENFKQQIRFTRDKYLSLTDFTQLSDAPILEVAKNDFRIFRQELRTMLDIPDITQAVWPTIPTSAPNISLPPFPPMPSFNG